MIQITDEMKVAAVKAYTEVDGKCRPAAMQKALEAALPFLPIAGEGKVEWESPEEWEIEQRSFHAVGRDDVPVDVQQLVAKLWAMYCHAAVPSSPGKDGGQEVEAVSDRGEPCPHCKGEGCQTGDPEGAPLEACDYCNGSGKKISTQPASTALVERLKERGQAFANQVRCITHLLHGQAYSTTVAELNAFDAALRAKAEETGR